MAPATPAPKPPLTPEQRRAAMLAGGIAGGLFGIGWGILGAVVLFGLVVAAAGFVLLLLFGGADVTGGLGAVLLVLLFVGLIIGVLLVILSVVISQRILRKGGVNRPKAVTWASLGIVLVLNTVAQRIADPIINLGDSEAPTAPRVIVSIVLGLVAIGVGIGTWLLMAHAFRGTTAVAVPAAPPVVPVAAPEPPAATIQNPPPAPPAPPAA